MPRLNRWTVTSTLLGLIRSHELVTTATKVQATWPGDEILPETIWVEDTDGAAEWPVAHPDRRPFDDFFVITLRVRVAGKTSEDAVMNRTGELIAAVVEVVQANQTDLRQVVGVESVEVGPLRGPVGFEVQGNGWGGIGEIEIAVHSRIT